MFKSHEVTKCILKYKTQMKNILKQNKSQASKMKRAIGYDKIEEIKTF